MHIFRGRGLEKLGQPHEDKLSKLSNHDKPNQVNSLSAVVMETKTAGVYQKVKFMSESHQLLQARNGRVRIAVGAKGVRKTSAVIPDTGAGLNRIQEKFSMTAWTPLLRTVKAGHLQLPSHSSMVVKEFICVQLQIAAFTRNENC